MRVREAALGQRPVEAVGQVAAVHRAQPGLVLLGAQSAQDLQFAELHRLQAARGAQVAPEPVERLRRQVFQRGHLRHRHVHQRAGAADDHGRLGQVVGVHQVTRPPHITGQ